MSGAVSSLDCGLFGSSLSAGSSVRQNSLSVSLWTLAGGSVSVLDFANLASAVSMRSYSRLGSNVSIFM
jgi:hypothetical protein